MLSSRQARELACAPAQSLTGARGAEPRRRTATATTRSRWRGTRSTAHAGCAHLGRRVPVKRSASLSQTAQLSSETTSLSLAPPPPRQLDSQRSTKETVAPAPRSLHTADAHERSAAHFLVAWSCLALSASSSLGGCSTNWGARASMPVPVPSHGCVHASRRVSKSSWEGRGEEREGTHRGRALEVAERLRELQRLGHDALLLLVVAHLGVALRAMCNLISL